MKRVEPIQLWPIHHSFQGMKPKPKNMSRLDVTNEQKEYIGRMALSIFADCTNAGVCFNDALSAVYLSGLEHGANAINLEREQQ